MAGTSEQKARAEAAAKAAAVAAWSDSDAESGDESADQGSGADVEMSDADAEKPDDKASDDEEDISASGSDAEDKPDKQKQPLTPITAHGQAQGSLSLPGAEDAELEVDEDEEDADLDEDERIRRKQVREALKGEHGADSKAYIDESLRGVVYLSRLPPFMKPQKLRHLMEEVTKHRPGALGRIFLQPEDKSDRKNRQKRGGNRKQKYTDGWVEFAKKSTAKRVAKSLNGTPVGGKKRHNYYRDDIWCMKYLSGFQWSDLKEDEIHNRKVRRKRLDAEQAQARREADKFVESVHEGRVRGKIREKREGQGKDVSVKKSFKKKFSKKNGDGAKSVKKGGDKQSSSGASASSGSGSSKKKAWQGLL